MRTSFEVNRWGNAGLLSTGLREEDTRFREYWVCCICQYCYGLVLDTTLMKTSTIQDPLRLHRREPTIHLDSSQLDATS